LSNVDLSILLVIEGDGATAQLIERLLLACRPFGIRYRKVLLATLKFGDLDRRTVPLFVRCGDPALRLWVDLLRRARHPYLYYIDDNFWELLDNSPVGRYYRDTAVRQSLEFVISQADQVLTNSEVLASYLQRYSKRLRVLPSFFDFALIQGCIREQTPELRIGFAGSPTRADDLDLIRPIIAPVLDRIPNAVFEFCGVLPREIQPGPRVRFFGHTSSYADFIRFQAERNWAIGMAPLRDHPANRAKTNNKYREYGACGIAGVYSDIPPYLGCVEHGVTGLLADSSSDAWLSAILLLALRPDERERIAAHAEIDVREKYSVMTVAGIYNKCIRATHAELLARPSHLTRAYLGDFVLPHLTRRIRILLLQVQDAYHKGGIRMVLLKTGQRLSFGLIRGLRMRGS
jgi:glycosyltransferase involved in cell wall biosynthesis